MNLLQHFTANISMFRTSYLTSVFLVFGCVIYVGFICGRESWWEYFELFLVLLLLCIHCVWRNVVKINVPVIFLETVTVYYCI